MINTADKFVAAVQALEPAGSAMWSSWRYSGIYCFTACPAASLVGTVHAELVARTMGVGGLGVNGAVEMLGKAADAAGCGTMEGWYYDNAMAPQKVVACPATCTRIQAASEAKVDLLFGCATILLL